MAAEATVELSLVVPTFNEGGNILELLARVEEALGGTAHEVVVVDDDSPDGTWEKAEGFGRTRGWVKVVRRTSEKGLSSAVLAGFGAAGGRFLGVMDADLSHDPGLLRPLLEAVRAGAPLAVGSRRVPGGGADRWPWFRRLYSDAATWLAKIWIGTELSDPMSGYFILRREVYERVRDDLDPKGYKILLEIATRAGIRGAVELPYVFRDRKQGYSKLTPAVAWKYFEMLWGLRSCPGNGGLAGLLFGKGGA